MACNSSRNVVMSQIFYIGHHSISDKQLHFEYVRGNLRGIMSRRLKVQQNVSGVGCASRNKLLKLIRMDGIDLITGTCSVCYVVKLGILQNARGCKLQRTAHLTYFVLAPYISLTQYQVALTPLDASQMKFTRNRGKL